MMKKQVLDSLNEYYTRNKERLGIERMGLFGSFVRNEQNPESDVDICISRTKPTLYLYAEISDDLQQILKRKIDLVSLKSKMSDDFRERLEKEVEYVE